MMVRATLEINLVGLLNSTERIALKTSQLSMNLSLGVHPFVETLDEGFFGQMMAAVSEQYRGVTIRTLKGRADETWASIIRYCRFSSIHGLVYFVKDNVSRPERSVQHSRAEPISVNPNQYRFNEQI